MLINGKVTDFKQITLATYSSTSRYYAFSLGHVTTLIVTVKGTDRYRYKFSGLTQFTLQSKFQLNSILACGQIEYELVCNIGKQETFSLWLCFGYITVTAS